MLSVVLATTRGNYELNEIHPILVKIVAFYIYFTLCILNLGSYSTIFTMRNCQDILAFLFILRRVFRQYSNDTRMPLLKDKQHVKI